MTQQASCLLSTSRKRFQCLQCTLLTSLLAAAAFFFSKKFIPLPTKKGGNVNSKLQPARESCASIFIHAEHALSSRNRDGDECCIYLSFTSWYANIMRSAHQITKSLHEYWFCVVFPNATGTLRTQILPSGIHFVYFLKRILSDNSGLQFPLRQWRENYIIPSA